MTDDEDKRLMATVLMLGSAFWLALWLPILMAKYIWERVQEAWQGDVE